MECDATSLAFDPKPIFITSRAAASLVLTECEAISIAFDPKPIFITSRAATSLTFEPVQYKTSRAECEAASLAFKLVQYTLLKVKCEAANTHQKLHNQGLQQQGQQYAAQRII